MNSFSLDVEGLGEASVEHCSAQGVHEIGEKKDGGQPDEDTSEKYLGMREVRRNRLPELDAHCVTSE